MTDPDPVKTSEFPIETSSADTDYELFLKVSAGPVYQLSRMLKMLRRQADVNYFSSFFSSNPNIIINGGFTINQYDYVSGTTLVANVYGGHDRWKSGSGGGTYTFTQLASSTTITIAANKTLIQIVEDKNVDGGTYTLSWEGTCKGRVGINSVTPSGAYAASPIVIYGQIPGTTMSVEFGNGASSGTLGKVKLELGTAATPFVSRLHADELRSCHRYCVPLNSILPSAVNTAVITYPSTIYCPLNFPSMRTAPTLLNNDILTWDNDGSPAAGCVSAISYATLGYITITGALTVSFVNGTANKGELLFQAGTTFSGSGGVGVVLLFHVPFVGVLSAEL